LPLKRPDTGSAKTDRSKRIAAAIQELGVVEPLTVYPQKGHRGYFLLLDGHTRFEVLKARGEKEAFCLIATDDEAFTYNHKVNQISPIQEHFMIVKAVENGVPEERIAAVLNLDLARIRNKRDLLQGICPEAVALLKDKKISGPALREVKKVAPMRQMEMAELMIASNNYSASYAKCLLAATPQDQTVQQDKAKAVAGFTADDMARMEREMETLGRDFRLIEESYGRSVLNLVIAVGYLRKLLDNAAVVRYLSKHFPEILTEFQKIVEATTLEGNA
jgi:ParB-like chromosome segregation protein Spo0J